MKLQLLAIFICLLFIEEGQGTGACHYFSAKKLDWFDALFTCQKKKLCLANMDSILAFKEIETKLPAEMRDEYWFGLNGYEKHHFTYISNGAPMGYQPPDSKLVMSKPCGYLKPVGDEKYTFETGQCGRLRRFVCSAAEKCNGLLTNSTYISSVATEPTCKISNQIKEMLGMVPRDK